MNRYRVTTWHKERREHVHYDVEAHTAADACTQVDAELKRVSPRQETVYGVAATPVTTVRAKQDFISAAIARPGPDPVTTKLNPGSGPL